MPRTLSTTAPKRKAQEEAYPVPELPNIPLLEEDGEPLESDWHVIQIHLLIDLIYQHWQHRNDFFAGGNMFVYYSLEQARSVLEGRPLYKGPDFFVVKGVDGTKERRSWVVWEEGGRYPDVIIELLSPRTARKDKEENVVLYSEVFRVKEYFWYDPDRRELRGYRLAGGGYEGIEADSRGWLWSAELGLYVGLWRGVYSGRERVWVRFYGEDGSLVLTPSEVAAQERLRAEQARQQAEQQRQRAEQARQQAEQQRQRAEKLAQKLRELGVDPETVE